MLYQLNRREDEDEGPVNCGSRYNRNEQEGLRIGAIFIILATSALGTLFPILSRRVRFLRVPTAVFNLAKYFGSGVIIATAFIHLLAPAFDELGNKDCLHGAWNTYDWAPALAMASVFGIFFVELFAFRFGQQWLENRGLAYDAHGHDHETGAHAAHGPERASHASHASHGLNNKTIASDDDSSIASTSSNAPPTAVMLGVAILEFGVLFHSAIIGLTLAVTGSDEFTTLFIVIIFHQMFEGLGLGSRLAELPLPPSWNWVPFLAAVAYFIVTPVFMAIGLGVRTTYNDGSTAALIVSGVLDALSAGILLYTGLVELLAHEFIFNEKMRKASNGHVAYASICVLLGAGLMALLGYWA